MHCPACTKLRFPGGHGISDDDLDEHWIPYKATDREGNNIYPVSSIDEINADECCDDCFVRIP